MSKDEDLEQLRAELVERHFKHEPWWIEGMSPTNAIRFVNSAGWQAAINIELILAIHGLTAELRCHKEQT